MRSADDYRSEQDFCSEFSARAGIFPVFSPRIRVVTNSQGAFRLWIRIRKLEATTTRRRRGSPVCKKELSSNRINDPLASIYRTRRGRWRGENTPPGRARTNSSNCLPGRTKRQLFLHVVLLPRVAPVRGKYYLLSCGAGKFMPSPEV